MDPAPPDASQAMTVAGPHGRDPGRRTLRTTFDEARADAWALVLHSQGIRHELRQDANGFTIDVPAGDYPAADRALEAYDAENRPADEASGSPQVPLALGGRSYAGVAVAVLLIAFYYVAGGRADASPWFVHGSAVSELIRRGEWWRAVTALTLHANLGHLLGNTAAAALFVTAVFRQLGTGVGAWLVLLAGAAGNSINALLHRSHHASVGFSTAVFGAIGILGGLEFVRRRSAPRRLQPWVAMAASVALLAMLGSGKETDLFAHLFGLIAGGVLGLAAGVLRVCVRSWGAQVALAALALGTLAVCWWLSGVGRPGG